jgi:membrane associated rhomboid family serine protease
LDEGYLVGVSNPTTHVSDSMRLSYALWFTLLFLVTIWAVFILNETLELGWRKHGLHPRTFQGWQGVFLYPFLHGDWGHLWNNTMSFFTLNGFLFYFYRSIAIKVWVWLYALSGLLLWRLMATTSVPAASFMVWRPSSFSVESFAKTVCCSG